MSLPHHDVWLRHVLDQQFAGYSWPQVQRGFENMIAAGVLCYHAWSVPRWAAPNSDLEINEETLSTIPADIKIFCSGPGADGHLTLTEPLVVDPVSGLGRFMIPSDTIMDLEIGSVSPLKVYQILTSKGYLARLPYDFDEQTVEPHLFVLACSDPKEYRD